MKENNCLKCPYYHSSYDSYIGDGDEWCDCGRNEYGECIGCKYPLFVRHLIAYIQRKRQEKQDKEITSRMIEEDEHKAWAYYNMSEDIYLLLQESAEEIENLYGNETELTKRIRTIISELEAI